MSADTLALISLQHSLLFEQSIDIVDRTIFINGEINESTVEKVYKGLTLLNSNNHGNAPITIKINSNGGCIYSSWSIVGLIRKSKCPVYTEAYGACMSSATTIFAAGEKRTAYANTFFLFHEVSFEFGQSKASDIRTTIKHFNDDEMAYCELLASASVKKASFWKKVIRTRADVYVKASELLKTGLVQEIF